MEELYVQCQDRTAEEFRLEVAFYHGWMAALDGLNYRCDNEEYAEVIERLRDIANAGMAETIGG
jgi:hypothetical protein